MAGLNTIKDTPEPVPVMPVVPLAQNADVVPSASVNVPSVSRKKSVGLSNGHLHKVFSRRSMTLPSFRKYKAIGTQRTNSRRKLSSSSNSSENPFPNIEPGESLGPLDKKGTKHNDKTVDLNPRPLPPTPNSPQTPIPSTIEPQGPFSPAVGEQPLPMAERIEIVAGKKVIVNSNSPSHPEDQQHVSANATLCTTTNCIEQSPLPSSHTRSYVAGPEPASSPTYTNEGHCGPLSHMENGHIIPCFPKSAPAHLLSVPTVQSTQTDIVTSSCSDKYACIKSGTAGNDPSFPSHAAHACSTPVVKNITSLGETLHKQAEHFPLRIKVLQGYCSEECEQNLSTNDVYDIHFVKHTRIISLKDKDGYTHHIPLASSMTFGIVYNPINDYNDALSGHEFENCSDIMARVPMPKVVCAMNTVTSAEDKNSIERHEILAVRNIQKSKFRGRRLLKVFSFLTNTEKLLSDDCTGHFTTKPSLIRLHLSQIIQGLSNPFPSQAVLYLGAEFKMTQNPCNSLSGVITLCDCTTETSLVVSPVVDDCADDEHQFSLPLNNVTSQIEIQPILWEKTGESDYVYDDTVSFDKHRDQPYVNIMDMHEVVDNKEGSEIGGDDTYATVGLETLMSNSNEQLDTSNEYDTVPFEMNGSFCTTDHKLSQESSAQSSDLQRIEDKVTKLTLKVESLESQVEAFYTQSSTLLPQQSSTSYSEKELNKKLLSMLSENQVEELLIAMDLKQYTTNFKVEHVTGDVLVECNDEILEKELGVTLKVHRIRLMNVITGKQSVRTIIEI